MENDKKELYPKLRSVEELMSDLENNSEITDCYGDYSVKTKIEINNDSRVRILVVLHNKKKIDLYDDKELGGEDKSREKISDEQRINIMKKEREQKKFIKNAANKHITKCEKVIARLPRPERKINMKRLISISISICLFLTLTACIVLYLDKIKSNPTGRIIGIKDSCYKKGEDIKFTMEGNGDGINKMIFKVNDSSLPDIVETIIEGKFAKKDCFFSTNNLKEDSYKYSFIVETKSGNSYEQKGKFEICHEQKPIVKISGIKNSYTEGDTIAYNIEATANLSLSVISFEVKDSPVKKTWKVSSTKVSRQDSFPTKGWKSAIYQYVVIAEDTAKNRVETAGSFIVSEKPDTEKPTVKISGIEKCYIEGDAVTYTIESTDNKSLSAISFEVKNSPLNARIWNVSGTSVFHQEDSFSTKGWQAGTYYYIVVGEDTSKNKNDSSESFIVCKKLSEKGKLSISASHNTSVYINNVEVNKKPPLTLTPIDDKSRLKSGENIIRLVDRQKNIDKSERIDIKDDTLTRCFIKDGNFKCEQDCVCQSMREGQ